jgi:iron complex outermembrane receptor protein
VFVGPDPSVATYVDDVPRIWGSMPDNLMTLDTGRVEILKGAQGGLYGRNATGGVVNVVTRQPSTDTAASGSAGLLWER